MTDVRARLVAGAQFNRVSRAQLRALGLSDKAITRRVATGQLVLAEEAVLAFAPVLDHDDWGRWMGATLTEPGSILSHASAAAAWGLWSPARGFESVTRPGNGGPQRLGGVLVFRSSTLAGDCDVLHGVPITTVSRTLLDLAAHVSTKALARGVREAVRLQLTTIEALADRVGAGRGRRGSAQLRDVLARYTGLPLERARSGAEVRALEILRDAGLPMPKLNVRIAGEEADLSWVRRRLIIEVDGGPFHLDAGEDARKEAVWESAGWTVRRLSADAVYEHPQQLIALTAPPNVARCPL